VLTDLLHDIEAWVTAHDLTIDLVTIWALTLGFATLSAVNAISWIVLRNQHDLTPVGKALKGKKASEAVMCLAMASLYGLTLAAFYFGTEFGIWDRLTIRAFVIAGIGGAAVYGIRFVKSLRGQNWGQPS
jgi:hypothetical protein